MFHTPVVMKWRWALDEMGALRVVMDEEMPGGTGSVGPQCLGRAAPVTRADRMLNMSGEGEKRERRSQVE